MCELLCLLVFGAILWVFQHLVRRHPLAAWAGLVATPLLLTPCWLQTCQFDLFLWVKLYSVILTAVLFVAVRFTHLGQHQPAFIVAFLSGVLNIFEAVLKDLAGGTLVGALNASAGLLLIASAATGFDRVTIDARGPYRDLQWDLHQGHMTWAWVACYSVWNGCFVYLNYPAWAGIGAIALATALLATMGKRAGYVQARVYTLDCGLLLLFTFHAFFAAHLNTSDWSSHAGRQGCAGFSFLLTLSYTAWFVRTRLFPRGLPGQTLGRHARA